MTFWEHVEELRKTLLRMGLAIALSTFLAFGFYKPLFKLLLKPLHNQPLYLFSPVEGFVTVLKVSFWIGLLASSPVWLFLLLQFILPALRLREKKVLLPFFALSTLFIGCGLLFAYTVTLPLVIRFFHTFNAAIGENLWGLGQTVTFSLMLVLAHGLVFELYVGLLFLIRFDLLNAHQLKRARRPVIVLILVLAAILTPPDILSQVLLAAPMLLLFETAIAYAKWRERKQVLVD